MSLDQLREEAMAGERLDEAMHSHLTERQPPLDLAPLQPPLQPPAAAACAASPETAAAAASPAPISGCLLQLLLGATAPTSRRPLLSRMPRGRWFESR